nr:MAG: hypothetical protein [Lake Baikal virophage 16]
MEFDDLFNEHQYQKKKMRKNKKMAGAGLSDSLLNLGRQFSSDITPILADVRNRAAAITAQRKRENDERAAMRAQIAALGGSALMDRLGDVGHDLGSIFSSIPSTLSAASQRGRALRLRDAARATALNNETEALRSRLATLQGNAAQGSGRGRARKVKGGVFGIPNLGIRDSIPNLGIMDTISPPTAQLNYHNPYHRHLYQRRVEQQQRQERQERDDDEPFEMVELPQAAPPATGGFINPSNLLNAFLGSRNSSNPAASMAARALIGNFLPSSLTNMGLSAVGLGKNKEAIRGLVGMGKNRKDVLFYPKNEVSGGFLSPLLLMTLASMAPSFLKNTPIGAVVGSGKQLKFEHNEELIRRLNGVKGGSQFWKDFGQGFSSVMGPASALSGMAAMFPPLTPVAGPLSMITGLLNSGVKYATGNGDPREYRRPSHSARKEQLALANMRGIETSNAKGGYVHRPTKSNKYENMHGGAMCGNMRAVGGARSARAAVIKDVMNERGVSMIEASKIVKNEGLKY